MQVLEHHHHRRLLSAAQQQGTHGIEHLHLIQAGRHLQRRGSHHPG
jgi:hypothetical protein